MTPGNEPLVCACGSHSATYDAGKGKAKPKWRIYSSERPSGKTKQVTTRSQKPGALQAVTELCKGQFSTRPAATAAAQPSRSSKPARERQQVHYDGTTRRASRPAGPGRGIKRSMDVSAVDEAEHVLKQPKASEAELRVALGRLTQEHRVLQHWYSQVVSERDQAYAMLKPVKLKSGARDHAAETRLCSTVQRQGEERATQVREGMLVGSECANETEPYIVSMALTEEKVWEGEPGQSWMGTIKQGVSHIDFR